MNRRLENRIAVISGAGSVGPGWVNGKATAVRFAQEGAKIFAIDKNPTALLETRRIIFDSGGDCITCEANVTDTQEVQKLVEICIGEFGRIDILHNNVGGYAWWASRNARRYMAKAD